MLDDPDATVRLSPDLRPDTIRRRPVWPWFIAGACAVLLLLAGGGLGWWWESRQVAAPTPVASGPANAGQATASLVPPPQAAAPPAPAIVPSPGVATLAPPIRPAPPAIPSIDRASLLSWQPGVPTLVRLADRPFIFLVLLPNPTVQAAMLNRCAALIEKARTPRDRVLDDNALRNAILADGDTPESYYYGHNYTLLDMRRFFTLARQEGILLTPEEEWLLAQLVRMEEAAGGHPAAAISVIDVGPGFDQDSRRTVLDHEIGHGIFFSDPGFAAHVMQVWRTVFTEGEREALRGFLGREKYDTSQEVLMANEAMAYLVFTPDRRYFDPTRDAGLSEAQAIRLREAFSHYPPPPPPGR